MKISQRYAIVMACFVLAIAISVTSCRKHKMNDMGMKEKNINYPAAYIVNGESSTISVIDLTTNNLAETIDLMPAGDMVMWPHHASLFSIFDIHRLAVGVPGVDLSAGHSGNMDGMKGKILILDAVKGTILKDLEVPAMNHNAAFSPDGKEIWTSQIEMNGKVLVYDAQNYTLKNTINVGMEPAEVTFSANGSKAYVANGGDNTVSVIDPASKAVITNIPVGANPVGAWVGFDGKMYVDNEDDKSISVIDVTQNIVIQTISLGFMPGSVAHNSVKKELWVTDPENGSVHYWLWNVPTNQWVHEGMFPTGPGAHAVGFANGGSIAYVTNQMAASVSIISVSDHSKIRDVPVGKKPNGILIKQ